MDWETHVVLAGKLLRACDLDVGASIYSVLPAIDIKPIHYHRQYAHLFANAPLILDAAIEILASPEVAALDFEALRTKASKRLEQLRAEERAASEDSSLSREQKRLFRDRAYFYERVADQAEGFVTRELAGSIEILGEEASRISRDRLAATLSLISHTYFDTFNNPVSVFIPLASNYAAQWELWKKIDYMDFKGTFYRKDIISDFRRRIADSDVWTRPVDVSGEPDPDIRKRVEQQKGQPCSALGFIKAMMERLGALAPGVSPNAVDLAIRNLFAEMEVQEFVHADRELLLCLQIEAEICDYIRRRYVA